MNALIDLFVSRSRAVVIGLLVILAAGSLAYRVLPKEMEPDIELPFVIVDVRLEGVSAEDSERLLVRPLEQELRNLEGVQEMLGSAMEGRGSVTLQFEPSIRVDRAIQDVRARVDRAKGNLPQEADEPRVNEVKFSRFDPMLVLNLGGRVPERTLNRIARQIKERAEGVAGVLEVNLVGTREELLEITVDPVALESYGLSPGDVLNFVQRNNRLVAAGALQSEKGRFSVKVPGVIENPADVLDLPMKVDGDRVVHFRDIASVRRTFKDAESFARLNGEPAVAIEVVQRTGSNMLTTVAEVKGILAEVQQQLPPGVELRISRDKSVYVQKNVSQLVNDVATAVILVVVVLIGILGPRNALLVGITIPASFCVAFICLMATGMTMNMVVFFGLIMAVGMVVDGAIVVVELADRRIAEGVPRSAAYAEAAKRMAWPIFSSIAATVVAFLPLVFWPGLIGNFLRYMPIVLVYTLIASLGIAMLFIPALGSIFGGGGHLTDEERASLAAAETGDLDQLGGWTGRYLGVVRRALDRPLATVVGLTGVLLLIFVAYGFLGHGISMFPPVDPPQGAVDIRARGDLSPTEKDRLVRLVEQRVYGIKGVESVYVRAGAANRGSAPDQIGSIRLNFVDWRERRTAVAILEEIRARTSDIAGLVIEPRLPREGPDQNKPITVELSSPSLDALKDGIEKVRHIVAKAPGVYNVEDTRPLPGIEWRLQVDRAEAARFGADVSLVGSIIQLVTNGIKVGTYRPDDADEEIDIRIRFPSDQRSLDRLAELRIPTRSGNVPIGTFVTRTAGEATHTIMRTDTRRTMLIQADLQRGKQIDPVVDYVTKNLAAAGLDASVKVRFKGGAKDQKDTATFLGRAFLIGLGLITMILVAEFNSLFQPLLVLTAVVFSTGGVLLGLMVTGEPFSLVNCGIGAIALMGIIVNNNIVLIDTYNKLRETGVELREAILRTCALRLRPVLLTKVTMILGLLPMALRMNIELLDRDVYFGGPGTAWWAQMASVIIGGLVFASVLTLVLTPSILMIRGVREDRRRARREARTAARATATR